MVRPLADLAVQFAGVDELQAGEFLGQQGQRRQHVRVAGAAGAPADLVGGVGLQHEDAARPQAPDGRRVEGGPDPSGQNYYAQSNRAPGAVFLIARAGAAGLKDKPVYFEKGS